MSRPQRPILFYLLIAAMVCIIVSVAVRIIALKQLMSYQTQTPIPIKQDVENEWPSPKEDPKSHKLAVERYRFVKRLEKTKLGFWPIYETYDIYDTVLFPFRRSDRIYLFYQANCGKAFVCYQHKDGQDKLVYKIILIEVKRVVTEDEPISPQKPIASLLDFITHENDYIEGSSNSSDELYAQRYAVPPGTSQFVMQDLAAKRDYIQYLYYGIDPEDDLSVFLLRDSSHKLNYAIQSVITKASGTVLTPDAFFHKYGLPPAQGE